MLGCGTNLAKVNARELVKNHVTWTYDSTAVGGNIILFLSNGEKLIVPPEHEFAKKFVELKKGGFIYNSSNTRFGSEQVARYLAPDDVETKKIVSARSYIAEGM